MCLGSINFGSVGKIIDEMCHVTPLLKDFGNQHCRFNRQIHKSHKANILILIGTIHLFNFLYTITSEVLMLKNDYNDRIYLHAKKKITL